MQGTYQPCSPVTLELQNKSGTRSAHLLRNITEKCAAAAIVAHSEVVWMGGIRVLRRSKTGPVIELPAKDASTASSPSRPDSTILRRMPPLLSKVLLDSWRSRRRHLFFIHPQ
jgi:hypothetical protein